MHKYISLHVSMWRWFRETLIFIHAFINSHRHFGNILRPSQSSRKCQKNINVSRSLESCVVPSSEKCFCTNKSISPSVNKEIDINSKPKPLTTIPAVSLSLSSAMNNNSIYTCNSSRTVRVCKPSQNWSISALLTSTQWCKARVDIASSLVPTEIRDEKPSSTKQLMTLSLVSILSWALSASWIYMTFSACRKLYLFLAKYLKTEFVYEAFRQLNNVPMSFMIHEQGSR